MLFRLNRMDPHSSGRCIHRPFIRQHPPPPTQSRPPTQSPSPFHNPHPKGVRRRFNSQAYHTHRFLPMLKNLPFSLFSPNTPYDPVHPRPRHPPADFPYCTVPPASFLSAQCKVLVSI